MVSGYGDSDKHQIRLKIGWAEWAQRM